MSFSPRYPFSLRCNQNIVKYSTQLIIAPEIAHLVILIASAFGNFRIEVPRCHTMDDRCAGNVVLQQFSYKAQRTASRCECAAGDQYNEKQQPLLNMLTFTVHEIPCTRQTPIVTTLFQLIDRLIFITLFRWPTKSIEITVQCLAPRISCANETAVVICFTSLDAYRYTDWSDQVHGSYRSEQALNMKERANEPRIVLHIRAHLMQYERMWSARFTGKWFQVSVLFGALNVQLNRLSKRLVCVHKIWNTPPSMQEVISGINPLKTYPKYDRTMIATFWYGGVGDK